MMEAQDRIAKHRTETPNRYRKLYDRCMSGEASPRQAIQTQCLECWAWVQNETTQCDNICCPLYQYRPYQKSRQVSDSTTLEPKQPQSQAGG